MSRRHLVAVLLVVAGVLFGIGTSYEAAEHSEHSEEIDASGEVESESGARILGVDAGSPAVIGLGIVLSFAAAAVVLFLRRRPADLAVAGFAAVFGALDLAEAVHGLREDEVMIGVLALVIAALHFAAAWLASQLDDLPVIRGSEAAA